MRIWLIQVGEPLPIDGDHPRLLRIGIFANLLASQGHEVLWWCSTFKHTDKTFRFQRDTRIRVNENLELFLMHSSGYKRNISLKRLADHRELGARFRKLAEKETRPDMIHCGFPTIELSVEAGLYGKQHNVPVILDVRDMWPDVFLQTLPKIMQRVGRGLLSKLYQKSRRAFKLATAISGHAPGFRDYGLKLAKRPATSNDQHFPFAYEPKILTSEQHREAREFWKQSGIEEDAEKLTISFFGTMRVHPNFDLETPINAAKILQSRNENVRFVFCGIGPARKRLERLAQGLGNVTFSGWVDAAGINALMDMSHMGLLPYRPSDDFVLSIPNKAPEYLSGALPILTCLTKGYLHDLLSEKKCGVFYESGKSEQLADSLMKLSKSLTELKAMSKEAKKLFEERFRADIVYNEMAVYLENIAKQGRSVAEEKTPAKPALRRERFGGQARSGVDTKIR